MFSQQENHSDVKITLVFSSFSTFLFSNLLKGGKEFSFPSVVEPEALLLFSPYFYALNKASHKLLPFI
jgi:hypothetical protein